MYADPAFAAGLELLSSRGDGLSESEKDAAILSEFQQIYRQTWNNPPTRRVLAHVQHLMLWDDHGAQTFARLMDG